MSLADEFEARMREVADRNVERTHGRYHPLGFRMKIDELGGVGAAKYWLHRHVRQDGIWRLMEEALREADWSILRDTMEYVVAFERRWRPLFTGEEIQIARERFEGWGRWGQAGGGEAHGG